jgi:hypothetical protein
MSRARTSSHGNGARGTTIERGNPAGDFRVPSGFVIRINDRIKAVDQLGRNRGPFAIRKR